MTFTSRTLKANEINYGGGEISVGYPLDHRYMLHCVSCKSDQGPDPLFNLGLAVAIVWTQQALRKMGSILSI